MRRAFLLAGLLLPISLLPGACALLPESGQRFVVFFDGSGTTLDDGATRVVAAASDYALAHPDWPVAVSGSGDPNGSKEDNADVVRGRLGAVVAALRSHGLGGQRVTNMDVGQLPFALNSQESRRVVIAVGKP